jgi:hypothetical protein
LFSAECVSEIKEVLVHLIAGSVNKQGVSTVEKSRLVPKSDLADQTRTDSFGTKLQVWMMN